MLTSIAVAPINHILRGESWACKRLQSYTGKTVCIQIPPFLTLNLIVQANGEIQNAANKVSADATLTVPPSLLPRLLNNDDAAFRGIKFSGDDALAADLISIGKNLRWNIEQDLSAIMGDIFAHRLAEAGKRIIHWQADCFHNLSQASVEYWVEEQPILIKPIYLNQFIREVNRLRNDAKRLEERVQKLTESINALISPP